MEKNEIVSIQKVDIVNNSEIPSLLNRIRAHWQAKDLISRVRNLIYVDPSSACQRLFNAAIHDLREKIIIAGVDIAKEAAKQNKLPTIEKPEDIEEYSTAKLIDLAYKIGFLTRPDWRRVSRCYEIRRDLEHEDNEYEAGIEDCIYIFKTCVEVILSVDPVHLLKVEDVKQIIEKPTPVYPSETLLEDYKSAPQPRQEEICKFLISIALDGTQSEVIRQNAYKLLGMLQTFTQSQVKLLLANQLQEKIVRKGLERIHVLIAVSAGILPYLKQSYVTDFFTDIFREMEKTGHRWDKYKLHGDLLRSFQEVGGLLYCPQPVRSKIVKWLVFTYVGEVGGMTSFGHVRPVFYSDTAAPLIEEIIKTCKTAIAEDIKSLLSKDRDIKELCKNQFVAKRYEKLLDIIDTTVEKVENI